VPSRFNPESLIRIRLANDAMQSRRRVARGSTEVRLLFIFDPFRDAVFLVGGDKSGKCSEWYKTAILQAEEAYAEYLRNERKK
jgi:hypothetical protein